MNIKSELIQLGAKPTNKEEAIEAVGALLVTENAVKPEYVKSMHEREKQDNTYLGKGVAIPHGTLAGKSAITETAIAILQAPEGVIWSDTPEQGQEKAQLIVGIAASGDEHIQVLRKLTQLINQEDALDRLIHTSNKQDIISALSDVIETVEQSSSTSNDVKTGSSVQGEYEYAEEIIIPNPQGMHARPVTKLTKLVKQLGTPVSLTTEDGRHADASKMMGILSLGITQHQKVIVSSDSEKALAQVIDAINNGLGDDLSPPKPEVEEDSRGDWEAPADLTFYEGISASNGLAIGPVHRLEQTQYVLPKTSQSPLEEAQKLDAAFSEAARDLHAMMDEEHDNQSADKSAIFEAHLELLNDEKILQDTVAKIESGQNAATAYKSVTDSQINTLANLADAHLAARSTDLLDVRERVMSALLGVKSQSLIFDHPVVLVAKDLTPSTTAKLNPSDVLAIVTEQGGATSHSAIIARGLGIPAVVGMQNALEHLQEEAMVIVDGHCAKVYVNPNEAQLDSAKQAQAALNEKLNIIRASRHEVGATADGQLVNISANINRADVAEQALEAGAEGVGLMRTEFLYMEGETIPSEQVQEEEYSAMAQALQGKPLVIRTLDIGGDKEVPYLNLRHEDNAFLGIRGIRLCFERPDLFEPQLRAICKTAKKFNNVHVMFPMISTLADWRKAKDLLETIRAEEQAPEFPVGMMIEVPSAALNANAFAKEVDFFSIGTNDLTQYTLAMDRMHPQLAKQANPLDPSVLRLIAMTCEAAKAEGKWVGVCGGAAGYENAAPVLVGLGVRELSMSPNTIATIKQTLRQHSMAQLESVAQKCLTLSNAKSVEKLISKEFS